MLLGAHVERSSVLEDAERTGSEAVQIFLSAPRTWAAPRLRGDEESLRTSGLLVYVHAPYLVNPASLNPEVRARSRQAIVEQAEAALRVAAKGLVVHGGHPTGSGTVEDGIRGWLEVLEGLELPVKLLVENTAGGNAAVARRFDAFARLHEALTGAGHDIGVCLDTCHAHAGGEELLGMCDRVRAFAGTIDLVHANDSRDPFDSGRDRHANLGDGACGLDAVAAVVDAAGCPAVVETPGGVDAMRRDLEALRGRTTEPGS
jgi:deoxyribonuclease-4